MMLHSSPEGWGQIGDSASYDGHVRTLFRYDPRPITSSISCSTARCASKLTLMRGRVNENGCAELRVTIPSNVPPGPMVPSKRMAGCVFNPSARPFALDTTMLLE